MAAIFKYWWRLSLHTLHILLSASRLLCLLRLSRRPLEKKPLSWRKNPLGLPLRKSSSFPGCAKPNARGSFYSLVSNKSYRDPGWSFFGFSARTIRTGLVQTTCVLPEEKPRSQSATGWRSVPFAFQEPPPSSAGRYPTTPRRRAGLPPSPRRPLDILTSSRKMKNSWQVGVCAWERQQSVRGNIPKLVHYSPIEPALNQFTIFFIPMI